MCDDSNEAYECEKIENVQWFIDSGCSDHLTNNKCYFTDYIDLQKPMQINAAKNGSVLEAVGVGNIEVISYVNRYTNYCTIKNILYVPELNGKICYLYLKWNITEWK